MQIIVVSDSHGKNSRLDEILAMYPNADMYLHCGDIETDEEHYPQFKTVEGNNDYFSNYPKQLFFQVGTHKIAVIHGHQFSYFHREEKMVEFAKENGCDILCYGHTHVAKVEEKQEVLLLNPGSLWRSRDGRGPSYAVLNIDNIHMQAKIEFIE